MQQQAIKIGMVDDHQIVLDGLQSLLQNNPQISIAFATTQALEVLPFLSAFPVDVLLIDIVMPEMNGIELAKQVKVQFPLVKILTLSMNVNWQEVEQLLEDADISGYALKNESATVLSQAIQKIASGGSFFSEEILTLMRNTKRIKANVEAAQLTNREIEIIKLIEQEHSNKTIATLLFISERTVETHRKNIMRKTGAHSSLSLVKYAYEHRLI